MFFHWGSPYKEVTSPDNHRDPVRCLLAPSQYSQPGRGPGPAPSDLEVLLLLLLLFPPDLDELLHLQHAPVRLAQWEHHLTVILPQEDKDSLIDFHNFIFSLIPCHDTKTFVLTLRDPIFEVPIALDCGQTWRDHCRG